MIGRVSKRWDQNITKLQKFDLRLESFKVLKKEDPDVAVLNFTKVAKKYLTNLPS